jgi:hypothetical protein
MKGSVAKPPEKKLEPSTPLALRVLPMDLQLDDRLVDERGVWRVVGRPYTTAGGKVARVRVELDGQPHIHEIRVWSRGEQTNAPAEGTGAYVTSCQCCDYFRGGGDNRDAIAENCMRTRPSETTPASGGR